jgi:hypothetical protein
LITFSVATSIGSSAATKIGATTLLVGLPVTGAAIAIAIPVVVSFFIEVVEVIVIYGQ